MKPLTLLSILAAGMTIVAGSPVDTSAYYVVPVGGGTSPACTTGKLSIICLRDAVKRTVNAMFSGDFGHKHNAHVERFVFPVQEQTSTACTSATVSIRCLGSMIKRTFDTSSSYVERDVDDTSTGSTNTIPYESGLKGPRSDVNINQRDFDDVSVVCNPLCPPGFKGPRSEADIDGRDVDDTLSAEWTYPTLRPGFFGPR